MRTKSARLAKLSALSTSCATRQFVSGGPAPKAIALRAAAEPAESFQEATLIALAILDRLGMGQYSPREAMQHLSMTYEQTLKDHIARFGEPTSSDWALYRSLFGTI
jgi:hypothetical protein